MYVFFRNWLTGILAVCFFSANAVYAQKEVIHQNLV